MKSSVSTKFQHSARATENFIEEQKIVLCAACGNNVADGERFCKVCGREVASATPAAAVAGTPVATGPAVTSGKAIVSLIFGFLPFPLSVVGIVCGHLSLSEIRKSAGRLKGEGLAIAGLVLGYLGIVALPIILIIAAIAIPNLLRARIAANESSAVASVRTINAAQVTYSTMHPESGYTCSLSYLENDKLISHLLAAGQKSGYAFQLSGCAVAVEHGPNVKYQVVACPVTRNQTGVRAFCSDESAVVKVGSDGSAQACLESGSLL